ncbi:hypothetical protein [Nocardia brevicatena]|uniref:hypothetical protein n=1 Tax=Nocardia brevicatena TaxID=37327 RepID=UPI0002D315FD|nr:hypothetical protein [Nocardia brevicatena]
MTTDTGSRVGRVPAALTEPAGHADPYPLYRELRELGPAAYALDGTLVVSGYRMVSAAGA